MHVHVLSFRRPTADDEEKNRPLRFTIKVLSGGLYEVLGKSRPVDVGAIPNPFLFVIIDCHVYNHQH